MRRARRAKLPGTARFVSRLPFQACSAFPKLIPGYR
jgi:hypothetical protein